MTVQPSISRVHSSRDLLLLVAFPLVQCPESRGAKPLRKIFAPLAKCAGQNLELLDTVQKIWSTLRKLFAPPGIPSRLRACPELPSFVLASVVQGMQIPATVFTDRYSVTLRGSTE